MTMNRYKSESRPVRSFDKLGRIGIPKSVRDALYVVDGDRFHVDMVNGCIVLRPIDGAMVCPSCKGTGKKELSDG